MNKNNLKWERLTKRSGGENISRMKIVLLWHDTHWQ